MLSILFNLFKGEHASYQPLQSGESPSIPPPCTTTYRISLKHSFRGPALTPAHVLKAFAEQCVLSNKELNFLSVQNASFRVKASQIALFVFFVVGDQFDQHLDQSASFLNR